VISAPVGGGYPARPLPASRSDEFRLGAASMARASPTSPPFRTVKVRGVRL